jgi:acyl-CoA synthetase (AMP-forming)/AMP-acid ligase II
MDLLERARARDPDAIAVQEGAESLSYATLVRQVDALASVLQELDPMPGSRIGICAYNTMEHLLALLATYAAGKVWVPLNPRNGRAELDAMVDLTRPSLIVADAACLDRFTPPPGVSVVTGKDATGGLSVRGLIERDDGQHPVSHERAPDAEQIIKFSGGSTGMPKAVVQSVRCLAAQAAGIQRAFEFRSDDVNLVAAPLTHGTSCFILPVLGAGGRHVLCAEPRPAVVLEALGHGITTLYAPPTLIYAMLAEPDVGARTFPALRHLIYSAAPMAPERIREARRVFGPVLETAYGQVEAPQIVTAMRAAEFNDEANLTSVGRAVPPTELAIMDTEGRALPPDTLGEIVVRGDLVMSEYLGLPELTARTVRDGWLHTGDLGIVDARGYLHIRGRLRETINTGGFKVLPADVEAVLGRHPAVAECCVFGVPDAKWGEAVHAAVRLHAGAQATEAALIAWVKAELDAVKAPKGVHIVASFPRTPAGKIARAAVRDAVIGEAPPAGG